MDKSIWITWEQQRRSVELAAAFNCKLYVFEFGGFFRYFRCIASTVNTIRKEKPNILFVQNPSLILACFSVLLLRPFFRIKVIVDRHTNFPQYSNDKVESFSLSEVVFRTLSFLSIRFADITIITNQELAHVIRLAGGRAFVLPDKIPQILPCSTFIAAKRHRYNVLLICSFDVDEPVEKVWAAAKMLGEQYIIYVSGNSQKMDEKLHSSKPKNVILTGFLSEQAYANYLHSVDAILVLTTMEYTLLCGCYEALSVEKPLITSSTKVLRHLFSDASFVENNPITIAETIKKVMLNISSYEKSSKEMKRKLNNDWQEKFKLLINKIVGI